MIEKGVYDFYNLDFYVNICVPDVEILISITYAYYCFINSFLNFFYDC